MNSLANTTSTPQRTQIDFILLDGSSSMRDKWWESLAAIDSYVAGLRGQNLNSRVILTTFDSHEIDCVQRDTPLDGWKPLSQEAIGAHWGSTPLYDAINLMGRKLQQLDPPRASIVIVTDGEENASRVTTQTQAKAVLDWIRAKGWQVTFIGAEFDNERQAALLGANPASAIGVAKHLLADAAKELAKKRSAYGLYGTEMHFTEGERQQFGGYLAAPEQRP